jgi:hypothetical protein
VRRALAAQRLVVPVVGAGVSQAADLPGSIQLRDELRANFQPHPAVGEFTQDGSLALVADEIIYDDFAVRGEVHQHVAEFLRNAVANIEPAAFYLPGLKRPLGRPRSDQD